MTPPRGGAAEGADADAGPLPDEGERTRLTRAVVAGRALALADKLGLDALTIRKLATELGVTPMALYWHFRGKGELLEGLAERLWSEIDITVDSSAPWTDQLRGLLISLLTVLRRTRPQPSCSRGRRSCTATLPSTLSRSPWNPAHGRVRAG